jgi:hypothetical protein
MWWRGENLMACSNEKCRRIHERGPGGPAHSKSCKGEEPANFVKAVEWARYNFVRTMLMLGFRERKDGYTNLSSLNKKPDDNKGFTSIITSYFGGKGSL